MTGFRSVKLPEPMTGQQQLLFRAFEHELTVLNALGSAADYRDFHNMDSRRQREARDHASDMAQARVAHLLAALEAAGAEIKR